MMLLMSLFLLLNGCGQPAVTASPTVANPSPIPTEKASDTPAINNPSPTPSPIKVDSKEYSKAYYDVVASIIKQYGFSAYNSTKGLFMGFQRGDLIDFDQDGVPELFCVYAKELHLNICIYRYDGSKAELLVDKLTGNSLLGDGTASIEFANINGKSYILSQDCVRRKTEIINIFTVDNGKLQTITFTADVQLKEETVVHYLHCMIDGNNVSEEDYIAQKKYYYKKTSVWDDVIENGKYRVYTRDDASRFIKSLASTAGVSESEVNVLLQSTPPPMQSTAPETPRQTTNSAG